jgi:hypothetical protein
VLRKHKKQHHKGSQPAKRPQSRQLNFISNRFEILEDQEEEYENPNTLPDSSIGLVAKDQEEIENTVPNIKGGTSFGVSSTTP